MAKDASCGFMIWDGRSKGTLNNVLNLIQDGKVAVLYFSPEKHFLTIRVPKDVREVLSKCAPNLVNELASHLNLERRLETVQNALPLEDETRVADRRIHNQQVTLAPPAENSHRLDRFEGIWTATVLLGLR